MTEPTETPSEPSANDVRVRNKAILFAALAEAGIHRVTIEYDGYADSGQMASITAWDDHVRKMPLPTEPRIHLVPETPNFSAGEYSLEKAVECLAWDFLDECHDGWENDDGAYGVFLFEVRAGVIALEHNERRMEVDTTSHEF